MIKSCKSFVFVLTLGLIAITGNSFAQSSSGKTAQKFLDVLVGTWKISKSYDGKKEISNKKANATETLEFTREAKYITRGSNSQQLDSGLFRMNEDHAILYLESANTKTPIEWNIVIPNNNNNTITLMRKEATGVKNFKYVYVRQPHVD